MTVFQPCDSEISCFILGTVGNKPNLSQRESLLAPISPSAAAVRVQSCAWGRRSTVRIVRPQQPPAYRQGVPWGARRLHIERRAWRTHSPPHQCPRRPYMAYRRRAFPQSIASLSAVDQDTFAVSSSISCWHDFAFTSCGKSLEKTNPLFPGVLTAWTRSISSPLTPGEQAPVVGVSHATVGKLLSGRLTRWSLSFRLVCNLN